MDKKRILMTGCSRSVGKETADLLRSLGHKVFGVGLGGPDLEADFMSVTSDWEAAEIFSEAEAALRGPVDVLINNAGITKIDYLENQTIEDFRAVMQVNLTVPYLLAKEMVKRNPTTAIHDHLDPAKVINIASMGAHYVLRCSTAYCCSKAAIITMTKQMAKECAGRIPVTHMSISPGGIENTAMIDQCIEDLIRTRGMTREEAMDYNIQSPMGRQCTTHEVAEIVRWLVMDAPSYLTGTDIKMQGGFA